MSVFPIDSVFVGLKLLLLDKLDEADELDKNDEPFDKDCGIIDFWSLILLKFVLIWLGIKKKLYIFRLLIIYINKIVISYCISSFN